jgi:hypothetical protein
VTIEFIIIVSLAVGAGIFVVIVATALVVHKWVSARSEAKMTRLHRHYSTIFSELILKELPPLPPNSKTSAVFGRLEDLIMPLKESVDGFRLRKRRAHRKAIRDVLVQFANDVVGEPSERLLYFFYSFKFVEEGIALMESGHWWGSCISCARARTSQGKESDRGAHGSVGRSPSRCAKPGNAIACCDCRRWGIAKYP